MQRITRDHTVPPRKRYKVREPVAEVALGERFVVETINFRTPVIRTPADANPETYREREETGPIFVQGSEPGDVLAIYIEDIRPEGHASGGWWDDPQVNSFLEISEGKVHFPGNLWAPLRMMIGDIYVTPPQWPPGQPWDKPRVVIQPPFSEYSVFYHRLTIDRLGRLFLSYDYWSTYWFYRTDHRGNRRALVMSPDGGETWKLPETRDLQ